MLLKKDCFWNKTKDFNYSLTKFFFSITIIVIAWIFNLEFLRKVGIDASHGRERLSLNLD